MSRGTGSNRRRQATLGGAVVTVLIAVLLQWMGPLAGQVAGVTPVGSSPAAAPFEAGSQRADADARIEAAVRDKRSGFMVTVDAEVLKLLSDDNEGSRHQRLLIELSTGRTLLVAHNIDLAPRVPASRGDTLRVRGQYEWNERGGVLHWTHGDPAGRHEGGWIEHSRRRYE